MNILKDNLQDSNNGVDTFNPNERLNDSELNGKHIGNLIVTTVPIDENPLLRLLSIEDQQELQQTDNDIAQMLGQRPGRIIDFVGGAAEDLPFNPALSRRSFVKKLAGVTVSMLGADKLPYDPVEEQINTGEEAALPETTEAKILETSKQNLSKLGFELQSFEDQEGNTKELLVPTNKEYLDILNVDLSDIEDQEVLKENIYDQVSLLINTANKNSKVIEKETGEKISENEIMDIIGTVIAGWGIMNGFKKGGITREDYLRMGVFTGVAYAMGDETRKKQLHENLIETKDAVLSIGSITALSDLILLGRKDIIRQFLHEVGGDASVTQDELQNYLYNLFQEQPELERQLESRIVAFEGESLNVLLKEAGEEPLDIATLAADISSGKLFNGSRIAALRALTTIGSSFGPLASTLVSTSLLAPLCRAIAQENGANGTEPHWNADIMSALQGYIPNNFGVSGLGFINGFYPFMESTLGKVPVIGHMYLGADFGPRLGIAQKAGKHGIEAVQDLDKLNIFTQLAMTGGFVTETLWQIAKLENRPYLEVLKEFADPREYYQTKNVLQQYNLNPNIKDGLIGRSIRSLNHVYNSFSLNNNTDHGQFEDTELGKKHQNASSFAQYFEELADSLKSRVNEMPVAGSLTRRLNDAKTVVLELTNAHAWEHAIGPELTDIMKTLPFQSLAVPYVEGAGKIAVDMFEKIIPQSWSHVVKDQAVDFATFSIFGMMSTCFDNFAAVKAGVTVGLERLTRQVKNGELEGAKLNKRVTAMIKKMYDAAVVFGGGLPMGNMPNFKMFPLNIYTLNDAISRLPKRLIPAYLSFIAVSAAEVTGMLPEIPYEWFTSAKPAH